MSDDTPERRGRLKTALMPALVLTPAVLSFGGVHPAVHRGLLVFYTLGLVASLLAQPSGPKRLAWHPILLVVLGFGLVAAAQTIPLPLDWLENVSPVTARAVARVDAAFGLESGAAPISLDPRATRDAVVRWAALGIGLLWLFQGLPRRSVRRAVPRVVIALGVTVVVTGLAQVGFGLDRVYGLLEPRHSNARVGFGGPFINANHAGQLVLLGAMSALVVLSGPRGRRSRWILGLGFFACTVGVLTSGSRGALAGLIVGIVSLQVMLWRARSRRQRPVQQGARLVVWLGLSLGLLGIIGLELQPIREYLQAGSLADMVELSKLELLDVGLPVVRTVPITGLGADAFSSAQIALAPVPGAVTLHFSYIENDYLQVLLDFGLIVPVVLVVVALVVGRHATATRTRTRSGRWWSVLLAFAVCSFVSFALPALGVILPALAVWAARCARQYAWKLRLSQALGVSAGVVFATGGALALAGSVATGDARDAAALHARALERPLDGRHVWETAVMGSRRSLSHEQVDALARYVAELAGRDDWLLEAVARYHLAHGQVDESWRLATRVLGSPRYHGTLLHDVVEGLDRPELVRVSEHSPRWRAPILGDLADAGRFADLMQVALELPDSALTLHYRVLASRRLGEPELARGFAEQSQRLVPETTEDCRLRARTMLLAGWHERALDALAACVERSGGEVELRLEWVEWSVRPRVFDASRLPAIREHLSEANVPSSARPELRREYLRVLALVQAREGACPAAALSLTHTRNRWGDPAGVPVWARELCPDLPRGPRGRLPGPRDGQR